MRLTLPASLASLAVVAVVVSAPSPGVTPQQTMSFFITSVGPGDGAKLGGLDGADRYCATRAEAAGVVGKEWRAYLSAAPLNGRGDTPNQHDILTGSLPDGTLAVDTTDTTCGNWTSNSTGAALVGHHDKQGGGARPTSWNSAHPSRGCSQPNLVATGGNGLFYCFTR